MEKKTSFEQIFFKINGIFTIFQLDQTPKLNCVSKKIFTFMSNDQI